MTTSKNVWEVMTYAEQQEAIRDATQMCSRDFYLKWMLESHVHCQLRKKFDGNSWQVRTEYKHMNRWELGERHFEWAKEVRRRAGLKK